MPQITAAFLRTCRENIRDQGAFRELREQVVGALQVLDQLIDYCDADEAPPVKYSVLGADVPSVQDNAFTESDKLMAAQLDSAIAARS